MSVKKLPTDVQSILSASSQINTSEKAVAELVYNALDAESTSIAVRVHLQDGTIQVIDNGNGVQKFDFKSLGQRHMTSKITDLSTFKSMPATYGYRGESLANIITISQIVKIISRHQNEMEKTWMKVFYNGKENKISELTKRPSKGTTVELKGFLYNLNIQKKAIDPLNELQNIKLFLEHISLIHNHISLSLRDDSKNEIVFKIHKKRDIWQTLSSLFGINKTEVKELQVEKLNYKVKGIIGTTKNKLYPQWIYINGRFIYNNSEIHKIVENNFNKYMLIKKKHERKLKTDKISDEEGMLFKKNIPCYFIFITCPYIDYHINDTLKRSVVEFKNWEEINKLLEKLVRFHAGDINLKERSKQKIGFILEKENDSNFTKETRDQVKKIIHKILGSDKPLGVSQLQKGVKGKLIKRNRRKTTKKNTLPKLMKEGSKKHDKLIRNAEDTLQEKRLSNQRDNIVDHYSNTEKIESKTISNQKFHKKEILKHKKICNHIKVDKNRIPTLKPNKSPDVCKSYRTNKLVLKGKLHGKSNIQKSNKRNKLNKNHIDIIKKGTESIEKRSRIVAERIESLLNNNFLTYSERPYSDINNIQMTHRTMVNHGYLITFPQKNNENTLDKTKQNSFKTTYDLVQTILKSQPDLVYFERGDMPDKDVNCNQKYTSHYSLNNDTYVESKLTFESHRYHRNTTLENHNINEKHNYNNDKNLRFITTQSRDNFRVPETKLAKHRRKFKHKNTFYDISLKESYTIEFSKTKSSNEHTSKINSDNSQLITYEVTKFTQTDNCENIAFDSDQHIPMTAAKQIPLIENTYTISPSDFPPKRFGNATLNTVYHNNYSDFIRDSDKNNAHMHHACYEKTSISTFNVEDENNTEENRNLNIVFVSKSQNSTNIQNVDAVEVCETVLSNYDSIAENEFQISFNSNNKQNQSLLHNNIAEFYHNGYENNSHHFINIQSNSFDHVPTENVYNDDDGGLYNYDECCKTQTVLQYNNETSGNTNAMNNFNLSDRLRFLPKGMSQIFANCNSKSVCDYNFDKDYFEDSVYNNFANDVQINSEICGPTVQNLKDFTTTDIQKVTDKLSKINASVIFDDKVLKEANILGQVDNKFIAAIMREKYNQSKEIMEYLVLFDQHAVHERIRLEKNLQDYIVGEQWESIPLDNIIINMNNDEILYLHNYRDKFAQLGLHWNNCEVMGNCEVLINAIPKAILGKNLREVEKIIKAVRNLIHEEIKIIKTQKGCVSLYPKAIMDLVCSEACRYAIKFGDNLSKSDCKELIYALSECKTPFQCAHGRPVMAVIMDVRGVQHDYNVNFKNVKQFILKRK